MELFPQDCPYCFSQDIHQHTVYQTQNHGQRVIYHCCECDNYFSETQGTPIAGLKTPLSQIIVVLKARSEGMGLNAAERTFDIPKKTILSWERRLASVKPTLLLYALVHQFLALIIEGDELYTKVGKNVAAEQSQGWTIVLMERASRFLWELKCGTKDRQLFESAVNTLARIIEQTQDLSLLTDGERRYGNLLFEICYELIRNGRPGRPKKRLPRGVRVRLKNKGSQNRSRGRKKPKYQAPVTEHPDNNQNLAEKEIHANHVEGFNASLRRRNSAFRRKTNTYAKRVKSLQRTMEVHWVIHNFIRVHFTTQEVPAVTQGILETGLSWQQVFRIRQVA